MRTFINAPDFINSLEYLEFISNFFHFFQLSRASNNNFSHLDNNTFKKSMEEKSFISISACTLIKSEYASNIFVDS
jgi:hypothetical protein